LENLTAKQKHILLKKKKTNVDIMQNTGEDYFGLISINVEGKYYKFMG